jgi:hypothetical protein
LIDSAFEIKSERISSIRALTWARAGGERVVGRSSEMSALADGADKNERPVTEFEPEASDEVDVEA